MFGEASPDGQQRWSELAKLLLDPMLKQKEPGVDTPDLNQKDEAPVRLEDTNDGAAEQEAKKQ